MKERFNFNDGDYQYDTKYVSDHIDNKYNKKNEFKKIKISVPNSSRGLRVRDNMLKSFLMLFIQVIFSKDVVQLNHPKTKINRF